jgi:hypothetical protein
MTWADLIQKALQRVNVLQAGEDLSATDAADGFSQLQMWVEYLATQRLTIPYILRTTFTISSTKGTLASPYTVGTGGDINVTKPTSIEFVRFQDTTISSTLEYRLDPLTDDAWGLIPQKNLTSTLPTYYYYNPTYQNTVTNYGSLYLWPVPTQASLQGVLYAPSQVPTPVNLTDTIVLPAGYQWFIQENLSVIYAATFRENLPVDPSIVKSAADAMKWIKSLNVRMSDLTLDRAVLPRQPGRYNITSDTY